MDVYSKLSFEVKLGCGQIDKIEIIRNVWDLDIDDFFELCKQLALGAGYNPKSVEEYWE